MPETPSFANQLTTGHEHKKPEPVGIRILGDIDPKTITQEMFDQSPDLLFHGSAEPINFSSEIDYQSKEYLAKNEGSTTLGFGFYTTNKKDEALNYSVIRKGSHVHSQSIATPILPYKARVLDLRKKDELSKNAPVPRELAIKWQKKIPYLP